MFTVSTSFRIANPYPYEKQIDHLEYSVYVQYFSFTVSRQNTVFQSNLGQDLSSPLLLYGYVTCL